MEGKKTAGDPAERVTELREMFLDFSAKFQSPGFILPDDRNFQKNEVVLSYSQAVEDLKTTAATVDLQKMITLPAFGEISKLELIHFVIYHTRRHAHQLNNILIALRRNENLV